MLSVIFTGSLQGDSVETLKFDWPQGLKFAGALLSILVAHEAGHYFVGRARGVRMSLPFFIPMPIFSVGGTMGAVIVQRDNYPDSRVLLEIGIAGPIAGFALALPLLILGMLWTSPALTPIPPGATVFGDSLLTSWVGTYFFGPAYLDTTLSIMAHPVAFGAWIGLLITGINLIPAGQLDGGHVAYALLGDKAQYITYGVVPAMLVMSFLVSPVWLIWAGLIFFFGRTHPPVTQPAVKLSALHYALALLGLLIFVLTFVPKPLFNV